jgi:hypothetical protein
LHVDDVLIDMVLEPLIETMASKELRELSLTSVEGFADPHVFTILAYREVKSTY